ncbi:uncharacterized protein BX664DRAFT_321901 [Halteromyces radiatus]|uniref:uncharacterized protein n=1 Tax=Halteromyces radiatus TaxID=101107 RepID=UPI0022209BAF|nr:uncharacterized protein BX664DRAFT_321901 [Halteromyces radiatus]KAI8099703.1 hypothetical protein BX664DRAFT_321901 [Halteromyces radiatus]
MTSGFQPVFTTSNLLNKHRHDGHFSKLTWQHAIAEHLSSLLNNQIDSELLCNSIETPKYAKHGQFALPIQRIHHLLTSEPWKSQNTTETANWIANNFTPNDYVEKTTAIGSFVNFAVPKAKYTEIILQQIIDQAGQYGFMSSSTPKAINKESDLTTMTNSSLVVISCELPCVPHFLDPTEFRGLVLATFLQRSLQVQSTPVQLYNTTTIWNGEFGYFALAFTKYGADYTIQKDLLGYFNKIYVQIKQDAVADKSIDQQAQQYLLQLESGHDETIELWQLLQQLVLKEYETMLCKRLPIQFDRVIYVSPWEDLGSVYDLLKQCDGLMITEDGEWKMDLTSIGLGSPVLRNKDGTSTRVTRDIVQYIKQQENIKDLQVIEYHIAGQHLTRHFQQVHHIINNIMGEKQKQQRTHVSFGKVKYDESCTGFCVSECLDSLQQTMMEIMEENEGTEKYDSMMAQLGQLSITTRNKRMNDMDNNKNGHSEDTSLSVQQLAKQHADKLGVCTMFVHQLTQRRSKPMIFSTLSHPEVFGNSGVFLQYVHSRLCGIERQLLQRGLIMEADNDIMLAPTQTTLGMGKLLYQQQAFDVVDILTFFPHIIRQAQLSMDPSTLVTYLFKMARVANQALYCLRIKDVQKDLALARWTLFWAVKQTLANGLMVLGIQPVSRM